MAGSFSQFFLDLYKSNPKWNFIYFYDPVQTDRVIEGFWTTLELAVICVIFSVIIGVVGAIAILLSPQVKKLTGGAS